MQVIVIVRLEKYQLRTYLIGESSPNKVQPHQNKEKKTKKYIFSLIVIGTIFFSGSLYLLATNPLTNFDFKKFGFIARKNHREGIAIRRQAGRF